MFDIEAAQSCVISSRSKYAQKKFRNTEIDKYKILRPLITFELYFIHSIQFVYTIFDYLHKFLDSFFF
jgi:hypothetical protein